MVSNKEFGDCAEPQIKKTKEDNSPEYNNKNPGETQPNPLSKNQIKKQKRRENFERVKKERRLKERERQKQKRQEAIAQGLPTRTGPSRKELKRRQTEATKDPTAVRLAIDLDFDELMSESDAAKCVKQCLRIYTINRRSQHPALLHFTGIKSDGRIHSNFKRNDGWENWHVDYHFDQLHTAAFSPEQIVYLTCESDTVLDRLDAENVYVIGGLVDHNHQKGLCHKRATEAGLRTARLPLSEHVDMKTRSVLSTYHVFEILVRVAEGKSWTDAILETIPMRKGAKPKQKNETSPEEPPKLGDKPQEPPKLGDKPQEPPKLGDKSEEPPKLGDKSEEPPKLEDNTPGECAESS